ncbi:hypothetical protein DJ68_09810 [Halorubrum sp. C3]|nr:hypothetical protein DJ68_09810 [Halorubrum sp. C3]
MALPNGVDDVIAVADDERVPDVRFGLEEGIAGSELQLVGDGCDTEFLAATVREVGLDTLAVWVDDKSDFCVRRLGRDDDVIKHQTVFNG